jgi:hypothetical protein
MGEDDAPRSPENALLTCKDAGQDVERVTGIEPALSAWEAADPNALFVDVCAGQMASMAVAPNLMISVVPQTCHILSHS